MTYSTRVDRYQYRPGIDAWVGVVCRDGEGLVCSYAHPTPESAEKAAEYHRKAWAGEPLPASLVLDVNACDVEARGDAQAPSYTHWQQDIENDRMREELRSGSGGIDLGPRADA